VLKGKVKVAAISFALPGCGGSRGMVCLLLDTHVFCGPWPTAALGAAARDDAGGQRFVIWEIAIKSRRSRRSRPGRRHRTRLQQLAVSARHAATVARLPLHHADPFDRLLVAQAISEPLILLTADSMLTRYSELVRMA
jgi:PIN domain nuclease of toxin-antitoxin system